MRLFQDFMASRDQVVGEFSLQSMQCSFGKKHFYYGHSQVVTP